jgi:hypothetical protein
MRFPWQKPTDPTIVAAEFVEYLRQNWPQLQVKECDAERVQLTMADGTDAKLSLHKLHATMSTARSYNPNVRRVLYEKFAQQMLSPEKQIPDLETLDAAQMAEKIFPRVVRSDMFDSWSEEAGEKLSTPQRPLPGTDFIIAYVLDFDDRVAYVMGHQSDTLGMDEATLFQNGLNNARKLFSRDELRQAMVEFNPKKVAHFMECRDGHASARLLLLPEYLEESEEIAAVVLENSAFLLAQIPPNNNWNPLREVARQGGSPHLHQPFYVTRDGIKSM